LSLPGCATECEKERKRADAERLKSETDRKVREKVEQESLTLKEQLVQVLKRLDRVEDHQKADQSEIVRVHCMVKEAVDGVGGVLKAVEAAQSSFHTLERNLLAKVVVLALSTRETGAWKDDFLPRLYSFLAPLQSFVLQHVID
jgi:predicted  nucleic acid-binding Zn-ribbon protein